MFSDEWWSQEVRFLQPKSARAPKVPTGAATLAGGAAQVALGVVAGVAAAKFLQSSLGSYVARSFIRGLIYRQVRALSR
jgi:hypothetical protein